MLPRICSSQIQLLHPKVFYVIFVAPVDGVTYPNLSLRLFVHRSSRRYTWSLHCLQQLWLSSMERTIGTSNKPS